MKYRRLLISFILMVVLPVSNFASVITGSHCHTSDNSSNSSHPMHAQIDEDQHEHVQKHVSSEAVDNHTDCECGCNGNVNCFVSGCSAAVLLNAIGIDSIHFTQSIYLDIETLAIPPDPQLPFRPPISLS